MKQRHRKHRRPVRDPLRLSTQEQAAWREMGMQHFRLMVREHLSRQGLDAAWREFMESRPVDPEPTPA